MLIGRLTEHHFPQSLNNRPSIEPVNKQLAGNLAGDKSKVAHLQVK